MAQVSGWDAFLVRYYWYIPPVGDPEVDPRRTVFLSWPRNILGFPQWVGERSLGLSAASVSRPRIKQKMDG